MARILTEAGLSRIAHLRKSRKLTQEELGERVGMRQVQISNLERGLRPSENQLKTLAAFFKVKPAELLAPMPAGKLPPDLRQVVLGHREIEKKLRADLAKRKGTR